jgi:hypothetical protein
LPSIMFYLQMENKEGAGIATVGLLLINLWQVTYLTQVAHILHFKKQSLVLFHFSIFLGSTGVWI